MIGIFIALLSGALMSVQGVFNTEVTKGTSMWVSTSWVQFSALVVCLGAWLFADRSSFLGLFQVVQTPFLLAFPKVPLSSSGVFNSICVFMGN